MMYELPVLVCTWCFFGHVCRDNGSLQKDILLGKMEGQWRRRGLYLGDNGWISMTRNRSSWQQATWSITKAKGRKWLDGTRYQGNSWCIISLVTDRIAVFRCGCMEHAVWRWVSEWVLSNSLQRPTPLSDHKEERSKTFLLFRLLSKRPFTPTTATIVVSVPCDNKTLKISSSKRPATTQRLL